MGKYEDPRLDEVEARLRGTHSDADVKRAMDLIQRPATEWTAHEMQFMETIRISHVQKHQLAQNIGCWIMILGMLAIVLYFIFA